MLFVLVEEGGEASDRLSFIFRSKDVCVRCLHFKRMEKRGADQIE